MKLKYCILSLLFFYLNISSIQAVIPQMEVSPDERGVSSLVFQGAGNVRNYVDHGKYLGDLSLTYEVRGKSYTVSLADITPLILSNTSDKIQIFWQLPSDVRLYQTFTIKGEEVDWEIDFFNRSHHPVKVTDMWFALPVGALDESIQAHQNLNRHFSLNGNASFFYWTPLTGQGDVLLMTMHKGTAIEYATQDGKYYLHSMNAVDRTNDSWRLPSTSKNVQPYEHYMTGFNFTLTGNHEEVKTKIYDKHGVVVKVAPGMVVTPEFEVYCALQSKLPVVELVAEYPEEIQITSLGQKEGDKYIYKFRFSRLGENLITVHYGDDLICFLDFFVTEPLETLIKKRARFIVDKQQHRDSSKWYNGLYSLWDMEKSELLSPDHLGDLREEFMVGGSDDPSNSKPVYVSEKNVIYPNKEEIASLEYYEENFVWGKLQRTDEEYPYPYGIYGSENWYQNRSGKYGGYEDGGSGKGRMWRTFDYTTHFAIYYNLYRIAEDNTEMVSYLDADGYLERAYRTAMAYFEVPYNILMGKQWAFHGWTDWAYKQGNFHERYLLDIINALQQKGRLKDAAKLRREWEKKVTYMVYEDPWPFGSEMFVDRTAFESSYYVAEYAKLNPIKPEEQFWYDKNRKKWYSYTSFDTSMIDRFMQNQLDGNLALRGLFEPGYANLGTAWSGQYVNLDYMTQMGGVALLDYAYRFSDRPDRYINYGYNSLLASWALMNTGTKKTDFGYWYRGEQNDGAVGWAFSPYQNSRTYMNYIKVGRAPWRFDGEIDHGLTGGIHGSGVYLLDDPDFGLIGYGGNVRMDKDGTVSIIPFDGVRRQVRIMTPVRFSVELMQDGFRKDYPITLRGTEELSFCIENRSDKPHNTTIRAEGMPEGKYTVMTDHKMITTFNIEAGNAHHPYYIEVPVTDKHTQVKLLKTN
ncbi:DUF5695 domain-containing protein [Bacteroides fragilis]|uniref:DUF5695 domain-containing protein n=1 Tax=Bacteroides fragilis TaxID=817 RepID=UPI002458BF3C|nr:DUF5695 domain-containing protein [Bacteroides fragilis]